MVGGLERGIDRLTRSKIFLHVTGDRRVELFMRFVVVKIVGRHRFRKHFRGFLRRLFRRFSRRVLRRLVCDFDRLVHVFRFAVRIHPIAHCGNRVLLPFTVLLEGVQRRFGDDGRFFGCYVFHVFFPFRHSRLVVVVIHRFLLVGRYRRRGFTRGIITSRDHRARTQQHSHDQC